MSPRIPFVEQGTLDTNQLFIEAGPLAKLIGVFVGIALIPFAIGFSLGSNSLVGVLFVVAAQFILAVGAGIVLIYVIARAIQLSDK